MKLLDCGCGFASFWGRRRDFGFLDDGSVWEEQAEADEILDSRFGDSRFGGFFCLISLVRVPEGAVGRSEAGGDANRNGGAEFRGRCHWRIFGVV